MTNKYNYHKSPKENGTHIHNEPLFQFNQHFWFTYFVTQCFQISPTYSVEFS
jgi:hypothetical protein